MAVVGDGANEAGLMWKNAAILPCPVAGYMAGVVHGGLVIVGGSYWENGQKHWTDAVQLFDPSTNIWRKGSPLPQPRSDAAAITLQNRIYILGGGAGTTVRADALVLDGGEWSASPDADLPEPRLYPTAIASAGYVYLFGGMTKPGDYRTISNTFWRWQPGSKGWESLAPLPGAHRIHAAMAELHGQIYVFGGATALSRSVENRNDAYRYDPLNNRWELLPDLPVANRSWSAVGLGGKVLLLAGYTNDFAREVYIYRPRQRLQALNPLPQGIADIKFFRIGNLLVGSGGEAAHRVRGKWTYKAELPKDWLKEAEA
jgi:N-acetylneuraminic acid mutarotase